VCGIIRDRSATKLTPELGVQVCSFTPSSNNGISLLSCCNMQTGASAAVFHCSAFFSSFLGSECQSDCSEERMNERYFVSTRSHVIFEAQEEI